MPTEKASDPNTFIAHDVPCHRCAYNLRGLSREGRCPECGAPVRVSLQGDLLRFADPEWLRRLSRGAKVPDYVLTGFLLSFATGELLVLLLAILHGRSGWGLLAQIGLAALFVVACELLLYGVWLIATPNPAASAKEVWGSPRRVLRVATPVAGLGLVMAGGLLAWGSRSPAWLLVTLTISPFGIVSMIGAWALCRYMRQLAVRLPDDFTQHKARSYFRGYTVSWLVFGAGGLVAAFTTAPAGLLAMFVGGLGLLAFGVLCLFLPSYLAGNLLQEMEQARQAWAEAGKAAAQDGAS